MNFIPNYKNSFRILKGGKISLVVSSFLASTTLSFAAPSGGVVTSGSANISQNGKVTDITQSTQKASINWNKFDIASDETVNFKQPNSSSITLNRVVGNEKSIINGALNANGQVWIINSNGVLFGKGASINTSGLLATTKDISDADFQAGNYKFTGNSKESVINLGTIDVVNNGYVILAANEVRNEGTIKAIRGKIHLAGADEYTVNLNGNSLVNLIVNKGVLDALVKNSGTIIANGGEVYLTTNAVNELLKGVVNNTGVIEANSLAGITGHVELFAHGGEVQVGGKLEAKEGFIETSGRDFSIDKDAKIETAEWLIDPVDITINDTLASAIATQLGSGNVTIETDTPDHSDVDTSSGESGSDGDITVDSAINWASDQTLTLNAYNNIVVNADITSTSTNTGAGVIFLYGQGTSDGGSSSYTKADGITVSGKSIQWKKGSAVANTRYAILDGNIFLGGEYIELGIHGTKGVFGSEGTAIPSLFFGRQIGNTRIGMTGDADGFGTGKDLRIDYFLPGSDYENYRAFVNGTSTAGYSSQFDSVNVELLPLGADNTIRAKVTSVEGDLTVVQDISFKTDEKFFNNSVVLTNNSGSAMANVAFAREFDPDNNRDVGGEFSTEQTIESTISSDKVAVLSGQGLANDAYHTLAGSQSNILFYSTDTRAELAIGTSYDSVTYGDSNFIKGYTVTGDNAMAIKFNIGTLAANSSSTAISYQTSLDNRDIASIIADLNTRSDVTPSTPTPNPTPTPEPKPDPKPEIKKIVDSITNQSAITVNLPANQTNTTTPNNSGRNTDISFSQRENKMLVSRPIEGQDTKRVSLSEARQMQIQSGGSGDEVVVPLSNSSIIQLIDGGVNLPIGVEQEFYLANANTQEEK
ncbi:two-partner secretion domain-containing protein [Aliarcobacter cryaerophilus]|uniref:two-partner secretion domain-containing protein n=1 Tax=Aliarcobacter cryaerophilus TaxID=28198 RepID=UPI0021B508BE|nr:filamentous hemagglutinin N-terminal domain-containing protein [Aliarcobacter cryaerophilus]MCT7515877.1 filamentous hemagglutinin N-terminal domain-containing protein [Aliarcobacter cryaerophilus]